MKGTFVDLDGEQIVYVPVPQIAAKIPEVVETIPQEHISDDLPVLQIVKENLQVIKVPPRGLKLVSQERGQQGTAEKIEVVPQTPEETIEAGTLVPHERVQQRTAEKLAKHRRRQAKTGVYSVQWSRLSWIVPKLEKW